MPRYTGWRRLSGNTADRPDLLDLVVGWTGQVHPDRRIGSAQQLGQPGEGRRALELLDLALDDRGDTDGPGAVPARR